MKTIQASAVIVKTGEKSKMKKLLFLMLSLAIASIPAYAGKVKITCEYPTDAVQPDKFHYYIKYEDQEYWKDEPNVVANNCEAVVEVRENIQFLAVVRAVKNGQEGPPSAAVAFTYMSELTLVKPTILNIEKHYE
jgi:hypothetical protein